MIKHALTVLIIDVLQKMEESHRDFDGSCRRQLRITEKKYLIKVNFRFHIRPSRCSLAPSGPTLTGFFLEHLNRAELPAQDVDTARRVNK